MKNLYLIRHGQTEYNRRGVLQGRAIDAPLNVLGRKQANAFYDKYKEIEFKFVLTSNLKRSIESVEGFLHNGSKHVIDERITEFSWGENEGLPLNEIVVYNYKKMLNSWNNGFLEARIPGGESGLELQNRVLDFIDDLKEVEGENVLVCTHGRTLKMLVVQLQNLPISAMDDVRHSNTALFHFNYDESRDKYSILCANETSHLPAELNQNAFWDK